MDYNTRAREIHAWAVSKGWWEPPKSFDEQVALYHSEVSEALEHWRAGHDPTEIFYTAPSDSGVEKYTTSIEFQTKPDGIPIELADVVIRVLDSAGMYDFDLDLHDGVWIAYQGLTSFAEYLRHLHATISNARRTASSLRDILDGVQAICDVFHIDLDTAIMLKMEYNETRAMRHGGKRV